MQRTLSNQMSDDYSRHPSTTTLMRSEINGTNGPTKKAVSWNDSAISSPSEESSSIGMTNGSSSSGFTLQDIDEVLGSTSAEASTLLPNTPNVIGSQEVYRDPRERIREEKMKTQAPRAVQGPEKLSFKEKMKMFAMTEAANERNSNNSRAQKENENEYTLHDVPEEVVTN